MKMAVLNAASENRLFLDLTVEPCQSRSLHRGITRAVEVKAEQNARDGQAALGLPKSWGRAIKRPNNGVI
jgi:hypothetical protein